MTATRVVPHLARRVATTAVAVLTLAGCASTRNVPTFTPEDLTRIHEQTDRERRTYRLEPGDTLLIRYPFHAEMDQETLVSPDGYITVPTVGSVRVAGRTSSEVEDELKRLTSTRLRNPEVLVNVLRHDQQPVYVGGEVGRPGTLVYREGITPLQAIIAAGGFLPSARIDSIVLVRTGVADGPVARTIDLASVVNAGEKEPIDLAPNDVIFVPRTAIANANVWVRQHITELLPFLRMSSPPMPR